MFYSLVKYISLFFRWIDLVLISTALYLFALLPDAWIKPIYPTLFWSWCRHFVRALNVDLKLSQHNVDPLPKHYILIANHPSAFEDVGIPSLFNVYSVAKSEVRKWPVAGRISDAAGTLYVKRSSLKSRKQVHEDMIELVSSGRNLAIYPEGGCFGRRIQPFRNGPFDVSLRTGVPILPIFLHYEAQDDFEWDEETLMDKIKDFIKTQNNRATYHVYDAIDPKNFEDKNSYKEHVHALYKKWETQYFD
ncbi:MAG: lysophospholipid acyltransferase family protein [Arenicellales bacterium]